ncbi:hypothetical protein DA792_03560 [Celeribacter baekdonensis]|uniref:Uncharacterized protein n=1 Tax=Celeribacter baekdonensis TaxID=875171 RepID=A0A2R4LZL3_9RHOB|nr:hypothetical protein DA792_03560 [Celeribacter baekdonensis]
MPFIRLLFVIFLTVASNVGALHASDGEASYDQHVLLVGEQGPLVIALSAASVLPRPGSTSLEIVG